MTLQSDIDFLLLVAAVGICGYSAYANLIASSDSVSSSGGGLGIVFSDLERFLRSDADELPSSLIQLGKIGLSEEFLQSVSRVTEGVMDGIIRGLQKFRLEPPRKN